MTRLVYLRRLETLCLSWIVLLVFFGALARGNDPENDTVHKAATATATEATTTATTKTTESNMVQQDQDELVAEDRVAPEAWRISSLVESYLEEDYDIETYEDEDDLEYISTYQQNIAKSRLNFDAVDLTGDPMEAAIHAVERMTRDLQARMTKLFDKAKTPECRAKIAKHFGYFLDAIALEKTLPFSDDVFTNQCPDEEVYDFDNLPEGVDFGMIQARTYKPPRNETKYLEPSEIIFCYGILAHDSAEGTIRFIRAVSEPTTIFVVHVDAKYEDTYLALKEYAKTHNNVHILDHDRRVRVIWGGFSMVNATLQMLQYVDQFEFTHFVHMAATAYPIASNRRIRNTIADYPADANFLHIILKPTNPAHEHWHYFVECDDRLHRIFRLPPPTEEIMGANMHTSSQWFIISKEFAHYLANPKPDTFLYQYLQYIPYVAVADESFFGTVLRNTPFCVKHHNWNFLHLQFDRWENERDIEFRDERKCIMPDPNHCGRSPTTMTLDYLDMLELSEDLFARKFLDDVDSDIKNAIDTIRAKEQMVLTTLNATKPIPRTEKVNTAFAGHGVLFVAKDTINDTVPMCLGLGETQNKVRLVPCFHEWVPKTLDDGWEEGAVILEETKPHTRWNIGSCSSDGNLERLANGEMKVTSGLYTPTGPRCMVTMMDGIRKGRCFDGESLDTQPGGPVHVYPCVRRWHQFISFGNGKETPARTIHTTIPLHTRKRIAETGRVQEMYMCIGVRGRGDLDEDDWLNVRQEDESDQLSPHLADRDDPVDADTFSVDEDDAEPMAQDEQQQQPWPPLRLWEGRQLVATSCSNAGAIIEWLIIPFIEEEATVDPNDETEGAADEEQTQTSLEDGEAEEL